jgi:hypothetical protein
MYMTKPDTKGFWNANFTRTHHRFYSNEFISYTNMRNMQCYRSENHASQSTEKKRDRSIKQAHTQKFEQENYNMYTIRRSIKRSTRRVASEAVELPPLGARDVACGATGVATGGLRRGAGRGARPA